MFIRPSNEEYPSYYKDYIAKVPDGDLTSILIDQLRAANSLLSAISETQANFRYAEGKWTLKEVLGHMIDTERIMSYRILRIARGDQTPLPGFNEDNYVDKGSFNPRPIAELLREFETVRYSTLSLIKGLNAEALMRQGITDGDEITVNAIAYIIAGHERHHITIIKERYL